LRRTAATLGLVACLLSCGPRRHAPGQDAFEKANEAIFLYHGERVAFGNTPEAEGLAAAFGRTLKSMRHLLFTEGKGRRFSLTEGQFLTYCQLGPDRVCFLVHVPELKNFTADARAQLLDVAWICAKSATSDLRRSRDRTLGVGLRGALIYGGLAVGPGNGTPEKDARSGVDLARLYPFFAEPAGPGEAPAAEAAPPAASGRLPATITEVTPRRIKGPWAQAEWRRPHALCRDQASPPAVAPADDRSERRRWQESCGAGSEPPPPLTVQGTGFSLPPSQNAVFLGGIKQEIVSGDASELVVRLAGVMIPPGPATLVVRTTPAEADEPGATDRSVAPEPLVILGPPRRVLVAEGDAQTGPVGSLLQPLVVRVVDARDEGVPGERVWFWVRSGPDRRGPPSPVRSEATTDVLGFARTTVTLPARPASIEVQAEAINAAEKGPVPFAVARATAVPAAADMEALLGDLRRGDAAKRKAAAMALADLGPSASAAIPHLLEAARSSEGDVKRAAVDALRSLKVPEVVSFYVAALQEDDMHTRMWAAASLSRMGPAAKEAVPALVAVLRVNRGGRDYGPRVEALGALSRIGREAGAAVPALVDLLADSDWQMRRDAAELLGRIGKPAAAPAEAALRKAAKDDANPGVRDAARRSLDWSFGGSRAPTTLTVLEGDGQSRPAGSETRIAVRVTNYEGTALANERVFFEVTAGSASLAPASPLTDAGGVARTRLLLGDETGTVTVEARYEGSTVVFHLRVVP
jgi:hypothetical protein